MRKKSLCLIAGSSAIAVHVLCIAFNCVTLWPWAEIANLPRNEQGSLASYVSTIEKDLVSSEYQASSAEDLMLVKTVTSELLTAIAFIHDINDYFAFARMLAPA